MSTPESMIGDGGIRPALMPARIRTDSPPQPKYFWPSSTCTLPALRRSGSFWCCVGTGMENHTKYGDTIYFHDDRSLYVNLFIASQLTWREKGLVVRQETRFPEEDTSHLTVTGDRIDIQLPMSLHTEAMPDDPKMIAVMYGPIVLAGDLGREGLETIKRYGPSAPQIGRVKTPVIPVLVGDVASVTSKIAPVAGSRLHFTTNALAQPHEVTLIPFYQVVDQRYTVYWTVVSPAEWEARKAATAAADARRKEFDAHTIDTVAAGDPQSERAHAYAGDK